MALRQAGQNSRCDRLYYDPHLGEPYPRVFSGVGRVQLAWSLVYIGVVRVGFEGRSLRERDPFDRH